MAFVVTMAGGALAATGISRVSLKGDGSQIPMGTGLPTISGGGEKVSFSTSYPLVSADTNIWADVYTSSRAGEVELITKSWNNQAVNGNCDNPFISAGGDAIAFQSAATNLIQSGNPGGRVQIWLRQGGTNSLVSHSTAGSTTPCNQPSGPARDITPDGGSVLFLSAATDLVTGDTNGASDLFLYSGGQIARVDVSSSGVEGNLGASTGSVSADGQWVAFYSGSTNLVANDTNGKNDIFIHSMATGETTRIMGLNGAEPNNSASGRPAISADGSYVAFSSNASNLVSGDTNQAADIFVWSRATGTITRVSVSSSGAQQNYQSSSQQPQISGDGLVVAFISNANNLVSGDTNNRQDVFVHSMVTGQTIRVSVAADGTQANDQSDAPALSLDGRFVAFPSIASNLVSGDTNNASDIFETDSGTSGTSVNLWPVDPTFGFFPLTDFTRDPVNISTGNATYRITDLSLPGIGFPLSFTRTYNSQDGSTSGPLGYGWNHSYSGRLEFPSSSVVTVVYVDGRRAYFTATTCGDYAAPAGVTDKLHKNGDSTYTLTALDQSHAEYGDTGRLTSLVDRYGNATTLTYNGSSQLTGVASAGGRSLTLTYTSGRITSVSDSASRSVSYGYDGNGNLTSVTDPNGHTTTYAYDSHHQLTSVSLPEPSTNPFITNTYTLDRVTKQVDALGNETDLSYHAASGKTEVSDARSNTSTDLWDSLYRLTSHTDPDSNASSVTYTTAGFPETVTDANSHEWTYAYNSYGNLVSATDPEDHEVTAEYDSSNHNLLSTTDAATHETTCTYDETGKYLTSIQSPIGTTAFSWNLDGTLDTLTDANSHTWTFGYNSYGDLTSVTDPLDFSTTYGCDSAGRVTSITDANDSETQFVYDSKGNVLTVKDPLAVADSQNRHQIDFTYDANDNPIQCQYANGDTTHYMFDDINNLTGVEDALSGEAHYAYDGNYNLTSAEDPNGHTTTYAYDDDNRLSSVTDPLSNVTEYGYDPVGNLTSVSYPNGNVTSLTYTDDNLLAGTSHSSDSTTYTYSYNPTHTVSQVERNDGKTWAFSYDAGSRMTSQSDENNSALGTLSVATGYDEVGNVTSITAGSGDPVTYSYNARNALASVIDPGGTSTFTQDDGGRLTEIATPEGSTRSFTYDAASRPTKVENVTDSGTQDLTYTYDANGNVLSEGDTIYTYDAPNRLHTWYDPVADVTTTYSYDAAGNLTQVQEDSTTTESHTYNAGNEITNTGYTYDDNGNLTSDGTWTYTYDADNQLIQVAEGETTLDSVTYDFAGRRSSLTTSAGTTYFHYAGNLLVAESNSSRDITATYAYDDADNLLSMTRGSSTYYYQTNAHGDVVSLTNSTGTVVATYRYDPWGKLISSTGSVVNPFRYAGYYYDSSTGLYYLWHRYYDPGTRRFLTKDSLPGDLIDPQSLNAFAYSLNNPVKYSDPSGLAVGDSPSLLPWMNGPYNEYLLDNGKWVVENPEAPGVGWRADPEANDEWAHWQEMKRNAKGKWTEDKYNVEHERIPSARLKPTPRNVLRRDAPRTVSDKDPNVGPRYVPGKGTKPTRTPDVNRNMPIPFDQVMPEPVPMEAPIPIFEIFAL